jgi:hypothetical protein
MEIRSAAGRTLRLQREIQALVTLMPDDKPQVTRGWRHFDGKHVLVNSAKGRVKDRDMRREPRVSRALIDPDTYRHLQAPGHVVEITEDGADPHRQKQLKTL